MAQSKALDRRLAQISAAASGTRDKRGRTIRPPRPILIGYAAEKPCHPDAGDERTIEIHNIQVSEAGDIVLDAWCRLCRHVERFRFDRITRHRTLRQKFQGPTPPVTPYFTALGPVGAAQLTRPITAKATTGGLLSRARGRIAEAARFRDTFGPADTYPRRSRPVSADDLLRQTRQAIATAETFRALVADVPDIDAAQNAQVTA
jgi:hypothetical protein